MIDRRSGRIAEKPDSADVGSARIDERTGNSRSPGDRAKITAAEMRVLTLVAGAKTNKEIATILGISPATVKRHLESILRKLQLRNRVDAAIYGLMINGCPGPMASGCALMSWWKERAMGD